MKLVGDFKLINIYYTPSYNSLSSSWMQIRGRDMCKVTLLTNMGTIFPALCLDSSVQKYTAPSKLTGLRMLELAASQDGHLTFLWSVRNNFKACDSLQCWGGPCWPRRVGPGISPGSIVISSSAWILWLHPRISQRLPSLPFREWAFQT